MRKYILLIVAVWAICFTYSCNKSETDTLTTTSYLDIPDSVYTYYAGTVPGTDSLNRTATLGRVLFYDAHLSLNNSVSCGSCHKQALGFADNVRFSRGFEGKLTSRNSPGINSPQHFASFFWDGRERVLANLVARPVANHVEMGIEDLSILPAKLAALPYYPPLFASAYGDSVVTLSRISGAVACFLHSIGSQPVGSMIVIDSTVLTNGGPLTTTGTIRPLSALEAKGKALFDVTYKCANCHFGGGTYGSSNSFFDIGLDEVYNDIGQGAVSKGRTFDGLFKVPSLVNVALTAPYMHDGRFNTLEEVLEHYSHGIKKSPNLATILRASSSKDMHDSLLNPISMNISDGDKKAIIAFLGSLTDYNAVTDVKFSNPFKTK